MPRDLGLPRPKDEVEVKLTASDPSVLDEIAACRELAGYTLRPTSGHAIRDRYWDTPEGDLAARRVSLRLRLQDGEARFTLKRASSVRGSLFRRRELELPASPQNWAAVRAELAGQGAELPSVSVEGSAPAEWLTAAGLRITQDRATERRLMIAERDGRALVELSLDTTAYHLGVYEVIFREIEAEALSDDERHAVSLGSALERTFPGRLSASTSGKYSRGLELEARLAAPYERGPEASLD